MSRLVNTFGMTALILIFGEIMPKSIAKANPEKIALKVSGILYFLIKILTPITFPFRKLNNRVIRNIDTASEKLTVTEDELETIIDTMEEEGSIDEEEATMLQKVLDLVGHHRSGNHDAASRHGRHRHRRNPSSKITDIFFKHKFSRIPVFDGSFGQHHRHSVRTRFLYETHQGPTDQLQEDPQEALVHPELDQSRCAHRIASIGKQPHGHRRRRIRRRRRSRHDGRRARRTRRRNLRRT
ncbi:MAG: DUF21 domain-containing protein [Bacillus subtilis]|nr:DUF21 domain-containing protein [Bacillus subtilis]